MEKIKILSMILCLSVLFQACSMERNSQEKRVRILSNTVEDEEESSALEYHFFYTGNRVSRIEKNYRSEKSGSAGIGRKTIYEYSYLKDTLVLRCENYGENEPVTYVYKLPLDETGKVLSMEIPDKQVRIHYVYEPENGCLIAAAESSPEGYSSLQALTQMTWTGENLSVLRKDEMLVLDYGDAPLDNTLNVDLLLLLFECSYLRGFPLWSIGLQGPINADLPQSMCFHPDPEKENRPHRLSPENGLESDRGTVTFSYKTDGTFVTSFILHYSDRRKDEVWNIRYE